MGGFSAARLLPDDSSGSRRVSGPVLVVCADDERGRGYIAGLRALGLLAVRVDAVDAILELSGIVEFTAVFVDIGRSTDWWVLLSLAALHGPAPIVPIARPASDGHRYRQFAFSVGCSAFVAKPTTAERLRDTIIRLRRGEGRLVVPAAYIN